MKIRVRKDLCCAAQLCVAAAPALFRLDELGYNDADGDVVPPDREDEARKGANVCPEGAIGLEN